MQAIYVVLHFLVASLKKQNETGIKLILVVFYLGQYIKIIIISTYN